MAESSTPIYTEWYNNEQLLKEILAELSHYCGEYGESEGALETLQRLIRERNEAIRPKKSTVPTRGETPHER